MSVGDGGVSVGDGGVVVGDGGVPVGDGDRSVPVGDGDKSVLEDEGDQSVDEDFCASRDTDNGFDDILFEEYVEVDEYVEGPKQKENQHEVDDEMSTDSSSSKCTEDSSHDDFSSCTGLHRAVRPASREPSDVAAASSSRDAMSSSLFSPPSRLSR
ncbi:pre-mRNA-splicing factor SLU7 [Striga asiatica]|uniref:Pre-mRNA-splicing factor SLU7 n=1 Tax=Striga asiatica TaxID=4170 RepID=A0A5A7R9J3_STRAF|nr:pre-mRNA-splicing factor SLU7 [Striga asiatica]